MITQDRISISTNNNGMMVLRQYKHDGAIDLLIIHNDLSHKEHTISPGDMVMLMNYYRNCKEGLEKSDYIRKDN